MDNEQEMTKKKEPVKEVFRWLVKNEWLIVILTIVALLRVPSLHEPNRYADEDIYLTLGQGIRQGVTLYQGIYDNKPPLLYIMAAIAGNVMWFRFLLLIWNLVNVFIIWEIAKRFFKEPWVQFVVTLLFGIFTTIPLLEGEIANGENFMIMPVAAAVLILLSKKERARKYLAAGICAAAGVLFKVPAIFEFVGLGFWLMFYEAKNVKEILRNLVSKKLWFLLLGFLLPIGAIVIYYFLKGAGGDFVRAAFLQNFGYLTSYGGGGRSFFSNELFIRGLIAVGLILGIWITKKHWNGHLGLVMIWFVCALFGSLLSGRPYPHYLLQVVAPVSLMIGFIISTKKIYQIVSGGLLLGLVGLAFIHYKFWWYPNWAYYLNFAKYISGKENKIQYWNYWGDAVKQDFEAGNYIRNNTEKTERIFVWGTEPAIYAVSRRLPIGRYTVAYQISDFNGFGETQKALFDKPPRYVVIIKDEKIPFPSFFDFIKKNYVKVKEFNNAEIYLYLDGLVNI